MPRLYNPSTARRRGPTPPAAAAAAAPAYGGGNNANSNNFNVIDATLGLIGLSSSGAGAPGGVGGGGNATMGGLAAGRQQRRQQERQGPPSVVVLGGGGAAAGGGYYDNMEFTQLTQDSFSFAGASSGGGDGGGSSTQRERSTPVVVAEKKDDDKDNDDSSATTDGRGTKNDDEEKKEGGEEEEEEEIHSVNLLAPSPTRQSNGVHDSTATTGNVVGTTRNKKTITKSSDGIPLNNRSGGGGAAAAATSQWLSSLNNSGKRSKQPPPDGGGGGGASSSPLATTPKGKGSKRSSAGASASAAMTPNSASSRSTVSPATQTLNALSQMDAAGGGNLLYDPDDGDDDDDDNDDDDKDDDDNGDHGTKRKGASKIAKDSRDGGQNSSDIDSKKEGGRATNKSKGRGTKQAAKATATATPLRGTNNLTPKKVTTTTTRKTTTKPLSMKTGAKAGGGTGWLTTTSGFAKDDGDDGRGGKKRSRPIEKKKTTSDEKYVNGANGTSDGEENENGDGPTAAPKRTKSDCAVVRTEQGSYTDRIVTLSAPGKLGLKIEEVVGVDPKAERMLSSLSVRPCVVEAVQAGSQAEEAGLGAGDIIFHLSQKTPNRAGRYASVDDVKAWAQPEALRPVIFIARRFDSTASMLSHAWDGNDAATELENSRRTDNEEEEDEQSKIAARNIANNDGGDGGDRDDDASSQGSPEEPTTFTFQGKTYATYAEMVEARRARVRGVWQGLGLLEAAAAMREGAKGNRAGKGSKKRKATSTSENESKKKRKSSRLEKCEEDGIPSESEEVEGGIMPDCQACAKSCMIDGGKGTKHHFLCPERSDHVSSGSRDHLKQIRRTLKRCDCVACKWYLKDRGERSTDKSKRSPKGHDPLCERSLIYRKNKSDQGGPSTKVSSRTPRAQSTWSSLQSVAFCRRCNEGGGVGAPPQHHVLCPSHPEFDESGAKVKLERIRHNATEYGCEACTFHLQNGRRDKSLAHGSGCDFVAQAQPTTSSRAAQSTLGSKNEARGASTGEALDTATAGESKPLARQSFGELRRQGAQGGCTKCQNELRSNEKDPGPHKKGCPLRVEPLRTSASKADLRRQGAERGCEKCLEEIRTGKKNKKYHSNACRLSKDFELCREGAGGGCKKCKEELRTGKKEPKKLHSKICPLSKPKKAAQSAKAQVHVTSEKCLGSKPTSVSAKDVASTQKAAPGMDSSSSLQVDAQAVVEADENYGITSAILETNRVTPSPKPPAAYALARDDCMVEKMESDSDDDDSQTLWEKCGNPWGDIGQSEEDHVILSPYGGGLNATQVAIAGLAFPRFNSNPFGEGSPYVSTHHPPSMGIRALKLTRDIMAMRPWGLTVKRHEFGGACLVSVVDPMSPAAAAEDIGGAIAPDSSARGLQLNDMILYANNKPVGNMTEDELAVEMEVCGPELLLLVSQYNGNPLKDPALDNNDEDVVNAWREVDKGAFDWQEIGPGTRHDSSHLRRRSKAAGSAAPPIDSMQRQVTFHDDTSKGRGHYEADDGGDAIEHQKSSFIGEIAGAAEQETTAYEVITSEQGDDIEHHESSFVGEIAGAAEEETTAYEGITSEQTERETLNICNDLEHDDEAARDTREKESVDPEIDDAVAAVDTREAEGVFDDQSLPIDSQQDDSRNDKIPGLGIDQIIADFSKPKEARREKVDDLPWDATSANKSAIVETLRRSVKGMDDPTGTVVDEENDADRDDYSNEDDPILGCICGETHEEPIEVFWLQCDECQAWYNNSVQCVGFSEEKAQKMKTWKCVSCGGAQPRPLQPEAREQGERIEAEDDESEASFTIGSRVLVECAGSLYKGTVRRVRKKDFKMEYLIHIDGNRKSTTNWTPSAQIQSLIIDEEKEDVQLNKQKLLEADSQETEEPPHEHETMKSVDAKEHAASKKKKEKRSKPKPICFETIEEIDPEVIEFSCTGKIERRRIDRDHSPISAGTLVRVADRSATSGPTRQGGVAKVMGRRGSLAERNLVYDVRYMVLNGREFDVSWQYVVPDESFEDSQSRAPTSGARRSRSTRGLW